MKSAHLFVLIAVATLAATPAAGEVIYGCKIPSNGRVTRIGTIPPTCNPPKVLVSWNSPANVTARVYSSVPLSIPDGIETILSFDSERWDTGCPTPGIHDTSSNTSRLTACTAATYLIFGQVQWDGNATGQRVLAIRVNGTSSNLPARTFVPASQVASTVQQISAVWQLSPGDYVELEVTQNSGGSLNLLNNGPYGIEFGMVKLP